MTPDLIAKYDRVVPRYTSYPTAPHFNGEIDAQTYRQWLSQLNDGTSSLYVHVPFCRKLCWYCGCHTWAISRSRPLEGYERGLLDELRLVVAAGRPLRLSHVHWGGGTPTALGSQAIRAVMDELRRLCAVELDAEIAIEIDPRVLGKELAHALSEAGFNRASIGVQDFSPNVQKAVNRVQPFEQVQAAVRHLRAEGIARINLDLMYGLPFQSPESIVENVDQAVSLGPQRLALFGYAHVPWMKRHQRLIDERLLPDGEARATQFAAACDRLRHHGYEWIGLDHFALPGDSLAQAAANGTLRRNFQGYTTDSAETLIGIGPSAIGALPQGYVQNSADLAAWRDAVSAGRFAITRGVALSDADRLRRWIIEKLMCDLAVNLQEAAKAFGLSRPPFAAEIATLDSLAGDGLLTRDGYRISLTEEGRPLMRVVASVFDSYFTEANKKHSRAV